ncbi:DUF3993 domain-containing protein [Metabacillus halosaccharovorans]|uniref:DUF3993 domain-containing protein n=1 Tax=Metabacillus halosaccharovorans TaxID=930124 RepID=A0ABT3DK55_9BACI|nr:DUF3993 domain-containing protein [Metabacillus halosaccharovorans]MCV9887437.1 DUF3993 domain-containing protein [Metabacillus halosaccharovorans]
MRQYKVCCSLLIIAFLLVFSHPVFAADLENLNRENILSHLQDAFKAQQSLSEKPREKAEMVQILSEYFNKDITNQYLKKNLFEEDGKYIVYGTDFPIYVIPFFTYDEKTKIVEENDQIVVYEFFPASNDGPVSYDDHYEWVKLTKTQKGLMVTDIKNYAKNLEEIGQNKTNGQEVKVTINSEEDTQKVDDHNEGRYLLNQHLSQILLPYFYSKTISHNFFYEKIM